MWVEASVLAIFIPTFLFVSATPGMCMTLAMTLGMTIGVKRTLWMMIGELAGVALVAIAAVAGIATMMLQFPQLFSVFKYAGGAYLLYLGIQMWRSRGRMAISDDPKQPQVTGRQLMLQGFVTAVANPKGWAFMISLLPPFLDPSRPISGQMMVLLSIIMMTELSCMLMYASGGKGLRLFLSQSANVRLMNRIAGSLMMVVGVWLAVG
ncbi:LysE family translocator [Paraferrimonas haliotis]|uniref:LysE family translocator n=1 Tax=Paraferrimonas haliotis TaxID=2013866 RepID=UPI001E4A71E6|nr:LysE family translocator [Paraferrimonas haliotis]